MTWLWISLGGCIYFAVCSWTHAALKSRAPKSVWDFVKMMTLPLVVFNLIKDIRYYRKKVT